MKNKFDGSSRRAVARRRRAAETREGEPRWVFFDGMNRLDENTPPGGLILTVGSEWM